MDWKKIEKNWPGLVAAIQHKWPKTSKSDLVELKGSRKAFAIYLAQVTDLTVKEADEEIEIWSASIGPVDIKQILSSHRDATGDKPE